MHTSVSTEIAAPIEVVWAEAIDFGAHTEWMADAFSIEFGTPQRSGVGTILLVETRLGPLRTLDRFTISELDKPHRITGLHQGSVSGHASWLLATDGRTTTFTWNEELHFPWFFGGRLGELIARPLFHSIWRSNLRRLKIRLEGSA